MLRRERFQCNFAQTRLFFRSLQCTPTISIFNFLHVHTFINDQILLICFIKKKFAFLPTLLQFCPTRLFFRSLQCNLTISISNFLHIFKNLFQILSICFWKYILNIYIDFCQHYCNLIKMCLIFCAMHLSVSSKLELIDWLKFSSSSSYEILVVIALWQLIATWHPHWQSWQSSSLFT